MEPRIRHRLLSLIAAGCLVPFCFPAEASLGGNAGSVLEDVDALHGSSQTTVAEGFQVIEIATDNGLHVREYLAAGGLVFAVAWTGPVLPDLRLLLGGRFGDYAEAQRALVHPGRHRSVAIATPALVLQAGGHLRAYSGRAFLPAAVPRGITPASLR